MSNIFVISDTHFNHENILKFKDKDDKPVRNFSDVHEMNEIMIKNWNAMIGTKDKVYHLGDVYFGNADRASKILSRLNGKKRLVLGNHDNFKGSVLHKFFEKVMLWRRFDHLLLTHVPVHESTLSEGRFEKRDMWNIHGHIHQNQSPKGRYHCVCVEHTAYAPVPLDKLLKL
jgi:calcineurin-like phosphoesterase family protein